MCKKSLFIIALLFHLLTIGCSSQFGVKAWIPWYKANRVEHIEIVSSINANGNAAVPVDIVFVYDENLSGELKKMNARDWFKRKSEIQLNFPEGADIMSWEMVPASAIVARNLPGNKRFAKTVLLFVFYSNNNQNRAELAPMKNIRIYLEESGFRLGSGQTRAPHSERIDHKEMKD